MTRVAAIDCGTNSTRVLVLGDQGEQLVRELRTTRLGQGVGATRALSAEAIDRTVDALSEFRVLLDRHGVERVRVVATSAARDAVNAGELFDRAEHVLGVRPELITGEEEGRLTYAGATARLPRQAYFVIDIGGGSTELVVGDGDDVLEVRSIDVGSVRLTEVAFRNDPYTSDEIEKATSIVSGMLPELRLDVVRTPAKTFLRKAEDARFTRVNEAIDNAAREVFAGVLSRSLIAVAGTATALGAVDLGLTRYDPNRIDGHEMTSKTVTMLIGRLASMPLVVRRLHVLPPERAEIIVAGAVILSAVMAKFGFEACRLSEADILDGMVAELRELRLD